MGEETTDGDLGVVTGDRREGEGSELTSARLGAVDDEGVPVVCTGFSIVRPLSKDGKLSRSVTVVSLTPPLRSSFSLSGSSS